MIVNNFKPITLEQARNLIEKIEVKKEIENISFNESLNRVLAEDIVSTVNIPDFDKSPLDGYAFRKEDVESATKDKPVVLKVIAVIMAGDVLNCEISKNEAVRIMTGAKLPKGANCIVRYEDTEFDNSSVKIFSSIGKNVNVIKKGEDVEKGDIVLKKDTLITPSEIGILASLGVSEIKVYKKPQVGIFATGSELLDINDKLEDGKIRNSNSYVSENLAKVYGADTVNYGIVKDDLDSLVNMYKKALENSDIVISSGGISVGDSDFVLTALDKIGVKTIFTRVSAKPGGHVFCGMLKDKLVFALSGNPAASFMNFYLYVRAIILKMQNKNSNMLKVKSILKNGFEKTAKVNRILRANTFYENGKYFTEIEKKQNSGVLSSMAQKNSIVIVEPNQTLTKSQEVEVEFLYEV